MVNHTDENTAFIRHFRQRDKDKYKDQSCCPTKQIISKVYKIVQVCNNKQLQRPFEIGCNLLDCNQKCIIIIHYANSCLLLLQALVGDLGFQVPEPAKHYGAAWGAQRVVVPTFVQFGQSKSSDVPAKRTSITTTLQLHSRIT